MTKRSITDIGTGEKVNIPTRDVTEPVIHHGQGGVINVFTGNKDFVRGRLIERPKQHSGQGGGSVKAPTAAILLSKRRILTFFQPGEEISKDGIS